MIDLIRISINECVDKQMAFCKNGGTWTMIPYFCGEEAFCKIPSEQSLEKAIDNIEKHYLFVGVLEEFELSLRVFEELLPSFFTGSARLFKQNYDMLLYSGKTKFKIPPTEATIKALSRTKQIKYEMRLYKHVTKLFYQKVAELDL